MSERRSRTTRRKRQRRGRLAAASFSIESASVHNALVVGVPPRAALQLTRRVRHLPGIDGPYQTSSRQKPSHPPCSTRTNNASDAASWASRRRISRCRRDSQGPVAPLLIDAMKGAAATDALWRERSVRDSVQPTAERGVVCMCTISGSTRVLWPAGARRRVPQSIYGIHGDVWSSIRARSPFST